jgi:hypothetical protein
MWEDDDVVVSAVEERSHQTRQNDSWYVLERADLRSSASSSQRRGRFVDPKEEEVEMYCPVAINPIHYYHDAFLVDFFSFSLFGSSRARDARGGRA